MHTDANMNTTSKCGMFWMLQKCGPFFFTDWFSEKFCIIILLFLRNNKL